MSKDIKTAAIRVLQQAGTPLHVKDITDRMLSAGLWKTAGKTPSDTVSARLYTDIKKNGEASAFVKVAPQTFALRDSFVEATDAEPASTPVKQPPNKRPSKPSSKKAGFSFTDCAEKVLQQFGEKKADALQGHHRKGAGRGMADDSRQNPHCLDERRTACDASHRTWHRRPPFRVGAVRD